MKSGEIRERERFDKILNENICVPVIDIIIYSRNCWEERICERKFVEIYLFFYFCFFFFNYKTRKK